MKKIGILTSSRADYGIYYPLLTALRDHEDFSLTLIAFGTHLSPFHGDTLQQFEQDGFEVNHKISSLLLSDDENSIAAGCALTALKFADFWAEHKSDFDLVFCLGDRFEMFGAVTAGIPFGIRFAHIHGGETTLGAIDNIYRHSITLASTLHFTASDEYTTRVAELKGNNKDIVTVGSLSLDNLDDVELVSQEAFKEKWGIDLSKPTVLMTVHPETVSSEKNTYQVKILADFLEYVLNKFQVVVTMPNVDTSSNLYRKMFNETSQKYSDQLILVENFGKRGYFSCMKHAVLVAGNSSSGIIEAASFGKYVLNLGDRQKGRLKGENIIDVPFQLEQMKKEFDGAVQKGDFRGVNPYYKGGASQKIIRTLENFFNLN